MSEKHSDISNEDGSVSLKKFLFQNPLKKQITIMVDGSGNGIAKDDPNVFYITSQMCIEQANYNIVTTGKVWGGVESYMKIFFKKEVENGSFDFDKKILAAKHSVELQQIIGLITIIASIMNVAKRENKRFPIYVENPEAHLHPSRQSAFVDFIIKIMHDYGWEEKKIEDKI